MTTAATLTALATIGGFAIIALLAVLLTKHHQTSRTRHTPLLDAARQIDRLTRENASLLAENQQLKADRVRLTEANRLNIEHWKPNA